ncbi:MAG: apolipoprotein N-acyltransferase [Treponema sp.]|jgi:apolipoprotein N-acyltransferase|nr:apolipoprotein N-acyltransferase [Treponema sp.]
MNLSPERGVRSFFTNLAAIAAGAVLFAAAFPNLLFENGLPLLAWIAYVPVFWVIRRSGFGACVFWGAIYGYGAYGLFNYWLGVFHPLAGLIVGSIYLVYMAVLFPVLKLAAVLYPNKGYVLQWLMWVGFEYLRTKGFLGYAYGVSGYSQWHLTPVIQIASVTGVWGVSAVVVFPSVWLAAALPGDIPWSLEGLKTRFLNFLRKEKVSALVWTLTLAGVLVFGFVSPVDYQDARKAKLALVQHNTDPWAPSKAPTPKQAFEEYWTDFRILKRLSDEAIAANPDLDLVVWSETAFVPRIYWHLTVRDDHYSYLLVRELLDYLSTQKVPFVIGNDDARKDPALNPQGNNQVDYNAVMLFEGEEIKQLYRKQHLVPFTEHFPYEKQLPFIYDALIKADTHFWEKGKEATVFASTNPQGLFGSQGKGALKFSSPVCFEDTFGYLSRDFVRNGAELIVNLTNDAWSRSLPAQMQHLSMAVFRAVENRRSMVRSTASGQTCAIDPNGRILAMAQPFAETWLAAEVPVIQVSSLYTRYGDLLPWVFIVLSLFLLILPAVHGIIRVVKK